MRLSTTVLIVAIGLAGCGGAPQQRAEHAPAKSAVPAPATADDTESPTYGLEPATGPRAEVEVEPLPPLR